MNKLSQTIIITTIAFSSLEAAPDPDIFDGSDYKKEKQGYLSKIFENKPQLGVPSSSKDSETGNNKASESKESKNESSAIDGKVGSEIAKESTEKNISINQSNVESHESNEISENKTGKAIGDKLDKPDDTVFKEKDINGKASNKKSDNKNERSENQTENKPDDITFGDPNEMIKVDGILPDNQDLSKNNKTENKEKETTLPNTKRKPSHNKGRKSTNSQGIEKGDTIPSEI